MVPFLAYLALCLVIGMLGQRLPLGFIGLFLLSVFLTPAVGLILLIVMFAVSLRPKDSPR